MTTVDTNVLVRILTGDDAEQASAAVKRIRDEATGGALVLVPLSVAVELEWVLRTQYGFPKQDIIAAYISLLEARELEFQDEAAVELALHLYEDGSAEFADCLHVGYGSMVERGPMLTFDRKAAKLPGAELIPKGPKRP